MGRDASRGFSRICTWSFSIFIEMICSILLSLLRFITSDDTSYFACDKYLNVLIKRLEHDSLQAVEWFQNNKIKLNQDNLVLSINILGLK